MELETGREIAQASFKALEDVFKGAISEDARELFLSERCLEGSGRALEVTMSRCAFFLDGTLRGDTLIFKIALPSEACERCRKKAEEWARRSRSLLPGTFHDKAAFCVTSEAAGLPPKFLFRA